MKILDLACGFAEYHRPLVEQGNMVYGVDKRYERIKDLNENNGCKYYVGDITKQLPFDDKFDVVLCLHAIEHVRYPFDTITLMLEHVKDDGFCYINTPNAIGWHVSSLVKKKMGGYHLTENSIRAYIHENKGITLWQNWMGRYWMRDIRIIFCRQNNIKYSYQYKRDKRVIDALRFLKEYNLN